MHDNLLTLASAVAGTADVNGGWVDLMKGTEVAADNVAGVNQRGAAEYGGYPRFVYIWTTGGTGTPSTTFTVQEADDSSGTNARSLGTAVVTTVGETKIQIAPVKRYIRLNSDWTQGVLGYSAMVGN